MIVMHATLPVADEHREAAVDLVTDLAAASREEPGVLEYRVTTDLEDESTLRVIECYEDEAAVTTHMGSEHFQTFQQEITGYLAEAPELRRFDVTSETQLM